jgi:hypothetical protein
MAVTFVSWLLLSCAVTARAQESAISGAPGEHPILIVTPAGPPQPGVEAATPRRTGKAVLPLQPVRLFFQSSTPDVSFLLIGGSPRSPTVSIGYGPEYGVDAQKETRRMLAQRYTRICDPPCEATLLPGRYSMALKLPGGDPVEPKQRVSISASSIVHGHYIYRRRMRTAGYGVHLGALALGIILAAAGAGATPTNAPMLYSGVGLLGASIAVGVPLMVANDKVYIDVYRVE